eukprot:365847_1
MDLLDYLFSTDFMAGCIAGMAGIIATQPLDTIRIRCQVLKHQNKSVFQHFKSIRIHEGIRGLFRGVASPTLTVGLMNAILFQTYESSKSIISKHTKQPYNYLHIYISGSIAGAICTSIVAPTELFKLLVQKKTCRHSATIQQEYIEATSLYKAYGFKYGIYRGLGVTILRDSPALGLYFLSYEYTMNRYDTNRKTQIVPFCAGGIAGLLSWTVAYPFDHIKTYYQLRKYKYGEIPLFKAVKDHIKREGGRFTILYKGLGATLLRCTPQHAVVFLCYENVKRIIQGYNMR